MAICFRCLSRIRCCVFGSMQTEGPAPKKLKLDEGFSSKPTSTQGQLSNQDGLCQPHEQGQNTLVKLKEEDVGITEYVGSHQGFFAILKQR